MTNDLPVTCPKCGAAVDRQDTYAIVYTCASYMDHIKREFIESRRCIVAAATGPLTRELAEAKGRLEELERACLEKDKALSWLRQEIRITAPGYRDIYWAEKVLSGTEEASAIIPPIQFPLAILNQKDSP